MPDLDELRAALKTAAQRQAAQKRLVANIAHEFRTPLSSILGFVEILRDGGFDDEKNRLRYLGTIERHARRMHWLIEDLLTLSRLETDEPILKIKPCALRPLATAAVRDLSELMRRRRLFVDVLIPDALRVNADERYLLQVFENLLSNAIKFNRAGGWIKLDARAGPSGVDVWVADTGCGVPEEERALVFERFYMGSRSGEKRGSGGLGLYIVKRIVEAHGGRAWCEPGSDEGAVFHFTLPAA